MTEEEWRPIKGYEGLYQISTHGRIKSFTRGKEIVMKPSTHYKGHLFIYFYKDRSRTKFFVHRLVALAFIPNPQMKLLVNHIDENKQNNMRENLEWMTEGENTRYYWSRKGIEINPENIPF